MRRQVSVSQVSADLLVEKAVDEEDERALLGVEQLEGVV